MYIIRGLLALKIFKASRNMIYMAAVITTEMFPFVMVLAGRVFLFTLLNLIAERFERYSTDPHYQDFKREFMQSYFILFLQNPDLKSLTRIKWILLFFQTIFINIVMLNLLISVVMNSYDRMKSIEKATEYKSMATMLHEVETNMSWNRKKGYRRYIHVFKYAEGEKDDTEEWNGKIRFITNKIESVQESVDNLRSVVKNAKII